MTDSQRVVTSKNFPTPGRGVFEFPWVTEPLSFRSFLSNGVEGKEKFQECSSQGSSAPKWNRIPVDLCSAVNPGLQATLFIALSDWPFLGLWMQKLS